jgi:type II secretory pathway pseudopilin PulG
MRLAVFKHNQRGFTLLVGMIMLVLITLLMTAAFTLSTGNLKAVGKMQAHDQAIAAANVALEQVLSSPFAASPAAESINVDNNNDGTTDYEVAIATPVCVRASIDSSATLSSMSLPGMSTVNQWNTVWDVEAVVTDANTGANTTVSAGMRVLLTQAQKDTVCS